MPAQETTPPRPPVPEQPAW